MHQKNRRGCGFTLALLMTVGAVGWGCTKAQIRSADDAIRETCELLAIDQAMALGVSVQEVIAVTCAVEGITREMRDQLLAQQLAACKVAGLGATNE